MQPPINITRVTADTLVKTGSGYLNSITLNSIAVAGTITIYDNTSASGKILFQAPLTTALMPTTLAISGNFGLGLYVDFDALLSGSLTLSYI